jgi:hypothetical protein
MLTPMTVRLICSLLRVVGQSQCLWRIVNLGEKAAETRSGEAPIPAPPLLFPAVCRVSLTVYLGDTHGESFKVQCARDGHGFTSV